MTGYQSKRAAARDKMGDDRQAYYEKFDDLYAVYLNGVYDGKKAAAQPAQELVAVYGYCPECGAKGVMRERRPNGNDKCANGNTYPSNTSPQPQPAQEPVAYLCKPDKHGLFDLPTPDKACKDCFPVYRQSPRRPWVGLTQDEPMQIWDGIIKYAPSEMRIKDFAQAIEAKLKEKNL